jgi:hypothetical protein
MNNNYDAQKIFLAILNSIKKAEPLIQEANQIDLDNSGDLLEVSELIRTVEEILLQQPLYNSTLLKNNYGKYAMETRYFNIGNIGVFIEDNNTYAFFELLLNLVLTHNYGYFNMSNKNYGVNNLLLTIVNAVLEENLNIKDAYKIVGSNNFINEYDNYVLVGGRKFLKSFDLYNDKKTIKYCYNEFNVFVDDIKLLEVIDSKAKIYSSLDLDIEYNKVKDVGDAISHINKGKYNYTSTIFSNNNENTLKFLTNVESRYVFSNVLLSANKRVGIIQEDLLQLKTIAYQENA